MSDMREPIDTQSWFFGTAEEDEQLEALNRGFWRRLLAHARTEMRGHRVHTLADVGCHRGGLLELFINAFQPHRAYGVEPLSAARERACFRLARSSTKVTLVPPERWNEVPTGAVDLLTCHEVLHLVADLHTFMAEVARVLRPGGCALIVLGCHIENPTWLHWKKHLVERNIRVHDHSPLDILASASGVGLRTALQPLRRDGWVLYDPVAATYTYASVAEMFDHQYRHKLLFRFLQPDEKEPAR